MWRLGFAEVRLNCLAGIVSAVDERLEVSLDCPVCQRRMRTVLFESASPGRCTPTGHEFPGALVRISSLPCGARYEFQYRYEPFTDLKYPDELRYGSFEKGAPTWIRVHFVVRCSKCQRTSRESIQTNLTRPWRSECRCRAPLFEDVEDPCLGWSAMAT